jgi:hypothetical protein
MTHRRQPSALIRPATAVSDGDHDAPGSEIGVSLIATQDCPLVPMFTDVKR